MIKTDGMKMTVDVNEVIKMLSDANSDPYLLIRDTAAKMIVKNANSVMDLNSSVQVEVTNLSKMLTPETAPDDMTIKELKEHNKYVADINEVVEKIKYYVYVDYFENTIIERMAMKEHTVLTVDDVQAVSSAGYDVLSRDGDYIQNIDDLFNLAANMKQRGIDSVK